MKIVIAVPSSFGKEAIDDAYDAAMVIREELKDTEGVQEICIEIPEEGYRRESWVIGENRHCR
ncbi:hypothetical protein GCM10007978_19470 [Shewanella hanedai]|uniref:Uncharacterized protein n=1 Tax=Shewanella hanedai TaxID=25 RepID=A0A553JDV8_SHEHA|nr:hypothetical protein [Shewanella hanedai]TRY10623.1 hypothetical protein FN961_25030 [Shewanella hanedai]GGI81755.1 hypothetical protein GCM10007978_19470 [Shewanella hanedai]